jgi:hypothetical protein
MSKLFTLILIITAPVLLNAQSVSQSVISSTGSFSAGADFSISSTTGEMTMVQTFSTASVILTQGFQQPADDAVGLFDMATNDYGTFAVYPNPATNDMWFAFQLPGEGEVTVKIYDVLGQEIKQVYSNKYESGNTTEKISVGSLSAGSYYLSLSFTATNDNKAHIITKSFYVIN